MRKILQSILANSVPSESLSWLEERVAALTDSFEKRPFYYAFSGVSRHFPKRGGLVITEANARDLAGELPGFSLEGWDPFRLARVRLLDAVLASQEKNTCLDTLAALRNTADLREQCAIFSAYSLFPHPEKLVESAVDGLRTNIVDVFDSIALGNPFPAEHFADGAWNQMVLKALFMERPLHRIHGLDRRANAELAAALSDYAHERWAADRSVSPELWRCCVPFLAEGKLVEDLEKAAASGETGHLRAVALAAAQDSGGLLAHLHGMLGTHLEDAKVRKYTWDDLRNTFTE